MYERILVAVDGGDSADLAMTQAIGMARAFRADIKLLYVVDDSELFDAAGTADTAMVLSQLVQGGERALDLAAERCAHAGVTCIKELVERPLGRGNVSETIVERADTWPADVIVMGTHGRRGMRRVIMGSVSEGVLAQTSKPVLLIRAEASSVAAGRRRHVG
ncbi:MULTISPECIES: universal stress protein [unclassified Cupriavidus]|uniref:universal stress protein n=1 Tax=unclassified Cupriavidus TaxID=2640874 RepID=UPI001BFFE11D|nr:MULTISPECIES: universal stress protein [unclassified Cupriavidus]MCA3183222.1 universal stress protein [Cupriavidus sp.]MCA3194116.1 universal stress protein [Cupriavidus sp.]MCA3199243.1 universal stress protein [Cupriavidus sp.]MCA3209693.1 universal stress protein [Cupriavidus sp.]MCA3233199.1 universal stress protein [Cupriavidus sp.]